MTKSSAMRRPPPSLLMLLLLLALHSGSACPTESCTCKWKNGKQTVECAANQLVALPDGMDPGTQVLNFTGNNLQVLRSERFAKMDLIHLQKIYLCRNQITRIYDRAFHGLANLVELDLADNLLTKVPTETFQDYAALMRLTLSGNPIRELLTNAFRHLSYLSTLELSNCQVDRIEDGAFQGLENLEWLRLDGNRIGTIRGQHVLPKSLHGIDLHGNRWNCDCRMSDLHAWLVNYNVPQQTEAPHCVYPPRLKGETIKYLKAEELACLPDITPTTLFLELEEGRNVSLHCDVVAIPEAQVTWLFQGQVLQNDSFFEAGMQQQPQVPLQPQQLAFYVEDSGTAGEKKHSELFLFNTKPEHNGTFTCVAENSAGRTQTNYTIRVLLKEVPVPEKVLVAYEYMLVMVVGAGVTGFIVVLLCCCLVMRCVRRSKRRRRESTKDSTVQLQNSKCSSIISDGGQQAPMPILKANGGGAGVTTASMMGMMAGGGGGSSGVGSVQQEMLYLHPNAVGGNNGQHQLLSHHQQQQQQHQHQQQMIQQQQLDMSASGQYCSPPQSTRNYLQHDQNPDLVNDAESNKCRQQQQQHQIANGHGTDTDDMASEHGGGSSIQGSHMSCENGYHPVQQMQMQTSSSAATMAHSSAPTTPISAPSAQALKHPVTVSAVPRFNPLATLPRGIIKDMYQHQVDVHLNPGYFLGGPDGYPVDYRTHHQQQQQFQMHHQHPMQPLPQQQQQQQQPMMMMQQHHQHNQPINNNQQVNYYRTLPHKPKQHSGGAVAVPRYSMEAEFLQRPVGGPPPFDAYTLRDMRYTAQGYPMQPLSQPQHQPHHPKQVAFLDQQYPSPPDGYKTSDVSQPLQVNTAAGTPVTTGAPAAFMHQWPPCLPGYHQQQQQLQQSQMVPIQTQPHSKPPLLHQASLISPTSSTSSSTTTQTSQTSAASATSASAGGGGVSKRCVGAQTLDPKDTIHEQNEEDDNEDDDDEEEVVVASGAEASAEGAMTEKCTGDGRKPPAGKLKHLSGPLADSPDEGYVGDSQDQGSDM